MLITSCISRIYLEKCVFNTLKEVYKGKYRAMILNIFTVTIIHIKYLNNIYPSETPSNNPKLSQLYNSIKVFYTRRRDVVIAMNSNELF